MSAGGGAVLVSPLWHALPVYAPWCPALRPLSLRHGPWSFPSLACWWFPAPVSCRPRCPVPVRACLLLWAPPRPLSGVSLPVPCPPLACALCLPGVVVVGWAGGLWGADGPCLGPGGLEPPAEGFGGAGGAEAMGRVPEEGFSCRLPHYGLQGLAGVQVRISSNVCTMCTPSRLPAPPALWTQQRSSRKAGADHQARWAGAWGGEGLELEVLERRWWGLGVGDAYGWWGQREAQWGSWGEEDVEIERRWRALRRPGEREQRWPEVGVEDAYERRGKREAR